MCTAHDVEHTVQSAYETYLDYVPIAREKCEAAGGREETPGLYRFSDNSGIAIGPGGYTLFCRCE